MAVSATTEPQNGNTRGHDRGQQPGVENAEHPELDREDGCTLARRSSADGGRNNLSGSTGSLDLGEDVDVISGFVREHPEFDRYDCSQRPAAASRRIALRVLSLATCAR